MKETIKITSVLTFVCILCSFLLAFVWAQLQDRVIQNEKDYFQDSLSRLEPDSVKIEELNVSGELIYKLIDNNSRLLGYAFTATGQGYQDKITLLAVIDSKFQNLKGVEVLKSSETPGLGAKIQEENFLSQFKGINVETAVECLKTETKQPNQIKAITSATVSSRAVVRILNQKIEDLRAKLNNQTYE
ncbi:MAG: FMN-binding protein [Candidatus Omnitrophica bacterium]|nr:FMN-binding protein [Candidatus Omnitrophota bacterium]